MKKHVLLCPEFESKGQCSRGKQCHLTHRRKRVFNDDNHRPKASFNVEEATSLVENDNALPAFIPLTQGSIHQIETIDIRQAFVLQ